MYADSACTRQAKRRVAHSLHDFATVGRCIGQYGSNATMAVGVTYSYCHN